MRGNDDDDDDDNNNNNNNNKFNYNKAGKNFLPFSLLHFHKQKSETFVRKWISTKEAFHLNSNNVSPNFTDYMEQVS
jgi:hypothetical protein